MTTARLPVHRWSLLASPLLVFCAACGNPGPDAAPTEAGAGNGSTPIPGIVVTVIRPSDPTLRVGDSLFLAVTVNYPSPGSFVWTSFDTTVVTVSQTGLLKARSPGTTGVRVRHRLGDGLIEVRAVPRD